MRPRPSRLLVQQTGAGTGLRRQPRPIRSCDGLEPGQPASFCHRRHDRHGGRHGHRPLRLHPDPARHDGRTRPVGIGCRVDRVGQLSRLPARRHCGGGRLGARPRAPGDAGFACGERPARRGDGPDRKPRRFRRDPLSCRHRQRLRHDLHHNHGFQPSGGRRPQRFAGPAFRWRRPGHCDVVGDDRRAGGGRCGLAGGLAVVGRPVDRRVRGGAGADRSRPAGDRRGSARAATAEKRRAGETHRCLRAVRAGLYRHRHLHRRHRSPGRRRQAVRGRRLAGDRALPVFHRSIYGTGSCRGSG